MSTLDMDLIFTEILPRLPVKSLMRFKCVSKSFKFEISSRNFSQHYLRYNSRSSDDDLLIICGKKGMFCYDVDISISTSTSIPISTSISAFKRNGGFVRIVGSCNGLLCNVMIINSEYFSVLNPTTRICQDICLPDNDLATGNTGFAFDLVNLDYKIVCISTKPDTLITKVYSLNANSWKILEFPFPNDTIDSSIASGTLVNNNLLHWKFWIPSVGRHRIGCFDVCKNEWTYDVLFPHHYYNSDHNSYLWAIAVINENLCSSFENEDDFCFEVWMMNKYGVQDSWVKLMTIHELICLPWGVLPVARNRQSGRLLMSTRHSDLYLWCDSLGGEVSTVTFDGAQRVIDHLTFTCKRGFGLVQRVIEHQTFTCKRSLVHLPDGHLFHDF